MSNRVTHFRTGSNSSAYDIGSKLVDKDYLRTIYPSVVPNGIQLSLWGFNLYGQVGDNTLAHRSTPRQEFTSSANWKQVSLGSNHTLAIKTDGTLWAWGYNLYGQVGDNTLANRSTPRQIGTNTNWKQVFAGPNSGHAQAIKTDGTFWAWGNNFYGQVGDNTRANRSTPRQIGTDTNWRQVAGGGNHSIAIKTDGTLWAWGYNTYGQVGDNTRAHRSTPRQIGTDTNWKQVAPGNNHSLAIKTDGTLWAWGRNVFGNIGDNTAGNLANRSTPRQEFTSSANWINVSSGNERSSALQSPPNP